MHNKTIAQAFVLTLIENVEGLYNSNGGRDFGVILQKLTSMGYAVAWRLLNSRYFGVPQSRSRVYLCCWLQNPEKAMRVMFDHSGAAKTENERKDFVTESNDPNAYPKVPKTAYCLAATSGRHNVIEQEAIDQIRRMCDYDFTEGTRMISGARGCACV